MLQVAGLRNSIGAALVRMRPAFIGLALATIVAPTLVSNALAQSGNSRRGPDLGELQDLKVPAGHKLFYHTYAEGVQIYRWDGVAWVFQGPEAVLYACGDGIVGIHYAGPTWESNSGSYVVGVVEKKVTPNPNAIQWLRLVADETDGPGVFARVTYIQRLNTTGGLSPAGPGEFVGEVARVPYTADYFFYRKHR